MAVPELVWIGVPDHRLRKHAWDGSPGQWRNFDRARRRDLLGAEMLAEAVVDRLRRGKLFAWQWRSDASAGWHRRGIERIIKTARDMGMDLHECYVSQCFYEHGKAGPSSTTWKILTNAKQLYYKLQHRKCPGHKWHEEELNVPVMPKGMIHDVVTAVMWEVKSRRGLLREEVEKYFDGAIQNSNATAIQNSNAAAIQNSNATAIQNSNATAIRNSNATAIQNSNAAAMLRRGSVMPRVRCSLALQRTSLPLERPTGKKLDDVKAQMLRA